jgi:hypothetical protein
MGRFVNSQTGVVVSVADDKDERFSSELWSAHGSTDAADTGSNDTGSTENADEAGDADGGEGYDGMKVADLRAEIERRNEGRGEADLLSPEGRKADLIAILQADDSARAEQ